MSTLLFVMFIWLCLASMIYIFILRKNRVINDMLKRNWDAGIYILLAMLMLTIMVYYNRYSHMIWGDDWIEISIVGKSTLKEALASNVYMWDFTPPLFNIIAFYLAKVIPHTFKGVFLIPESFLCVSVVIMGFVGRNLFSKKYGVISAILTATSATLILSAGYEFRSYSMYFMFSAFIMLVFIKKIKKRKVFSRNPTSINCKLYWINTITLFWFYVSRNVLLV